MRAASSCIVEFVQLLREGRLALIPQRVEPARKLLPVAGHLAEALGCLQALGLLQEG